MHVFAVNHVLSGLALGAQKLTKLWYFSIISFEMATQKWARGLALSPYSEIVEGIYLILDTVAWYCLFNSWCCFFQFVLDFPSPCFNFKFYCVVWGQISICRWKEMSVAQDKDFIPLWNIPNKVEKEAGWKLVFRSKNKNSTQVLFPSQSPIQYFQGRPIKRPHYLLISPPIAYCEINCLVSYQNLTPTLYL